MSFSPRRVMLNVAMGREELHDHLWLCLLCNTCEAVCPNAVHIPEVVEALRRMLVRRGLERGDLEVYLEALDNILSRGVMMAPVNDKVRDFNEPRGLNPRLLPEYVRAELRKIIGGRGPKPRGKKA